MNGIIHISGMLTKSNLPMNQRLSEAGIMVVKGMLMVFAVLAVLMFVLMLMERFFTKKPAPKKEEPAPAPAVAAAPTPAPEPTVVEDDGAIVAAITAAIAVVLAEGGYNGGFRVVSFKRADRRSAWNTK